MEKDFPPDEEYDRQCGEVFLTIKGELLIHCTLCETRYKGFQNYTEHISKVHCLHNEAENFGLGEFLTIYKRKDDSYRPSHDFVENDKNIELEFFSSNEQNKETENFIPMSEEFDINSEILDELKISNGNLLDSLNDMPTNKPFKYRFNASRRAKTTQTAKKGRIHHCPECNFSFADKSNLIAHINRHTAYKPHQCESCAKTFYTRSELFTHIRSHTGERPFLCPHCGQGFITSSKLTSHIKRHENSHDQECAICGVKFRTNGALKRHASVHSLERPFKC